MEQHTATIKKPIPDWALAAIAGAGGILACIVPLTLLLLPGFWAYALCRMKKPAVLALCIGLLGGCSVFLYGMLTGLCITAIAFGTTLILYFFQTKKLGNTYSLAACAAWCVLCLYGAVCMPGILSGAGPYAEIQGRMDVFLGAMREFFQTMPMEEGTGKAVFAYLDMIGESTSAMIVPCICAGAEMIALSNLLFFRLFARKQQLDICPLRPFSLWAIPENMTFGIFALLIGSMVMEWIGWEYSNALTNTVNVIVGLPLILQGLSMADFMILRSGKNVRGRRILIYLLCGLFFSLAQMPLLLLGCSEQLFHIRKRMIEGPPPQSPDF